MNVGVVFPQTEIGNDPAAIKDYAQATENLGFSHLLAYDHVLGANPVRPGGWNGPYTSETPFHEVFVLFSFLAGVTHTLSFTTGILILPQRQTALVAKQAASLDVLSGGRLRLGVGLGWNQVEYAALNEDFHTRGKRIEEQVTLLRRLWTEPTIQFEGTWHHIPDAGINPLPIQRPIPIWFGGEADPVLERTARLGDGWFPQAKTAQKAAPLLEKLDHYLAAAGRTRAELGIEPRLNYGHATPDEWHQIASDWEQAGAGYLSVNTMGCGLKTPQEHILAISKLAHALIHSS